MELTAEEEGTRLILTHSRTSAPPAVDFAAGWHYLDTLSFLIEGVEPPAASIRIPSDRRVGLKSHRG